MSEMNARGAEYSDDHVCLCVSVCLSARVSRTPTNLSNIYIRQVNGVKLADIMPVNNRFQATRAKSQNFHYLYMQTMSYQSQPNFVL